MTFKIQTLEKFREAEARLEYLKTDPKPSNVEEFIKKYWPFLRLLAQIFRILCKKRIRPEVDEFILLGDQHHSVDKFPDTDSLSAQL